MCNVSPYVFWICALKSRGHFNIFAIKDCLSHFDEKCEAITNQILNKGSVSLCLCVPTQSLSFRMMLLKAVRLKAVHQFD